MQFSRTTVDDQPIYLPIPENCSRGAKLSNVGRSRGPFCHHSGCCSSCCCCCFSASPIFGGCHAASIVYAFGNVSYVAQVACRVSRATLCATPLSDCITPATHTHTHTHSYTCICMYSLILISPISCKKCRPRLARRLSLLWLSFR